MIKFVDSKLLYKPILLFRWLYCGWLFIFSKLWIACCWVITLSFLWYCWKMKIKKIKEKKR
jgi:hypothetical protein